MKRTIYKAPPGRTITAVQGDSNGWVYLVNDVDTNHKRKVVAKAGWGTFHLYGDRKGDDLGSYTRVVAKFSKSVKVHTK